MILAKLTQILLYSLASFGLAMLLYPCYIRFLQRLKVGKTIREEDGSGQKSVIFSQMHAHKAGTPNMGGGMFLLVVLLMVLFSFVLQYFGLINNSLVTREETYIILFCFFSFGLLGLLDDYLNIKGKGAIKGLSAKAKLLGMFVISGAMSWWFFGPLDVDFITLGADFQVSLGWFAPLLSFFLTISIANAINITDGLDGLAGGLLFLVLGVFGVATFVAQLYIATAVLGIVIAVLAAFLWFNINPAKIFMGDGGAFALAGLISSLVFLLNMRMGILIPFLVVFLVFWLEIASSAIQLFSKKFRGKKVFSIAPLHHLFEHRGHKETEIVMKAWLLQGILCVIGLMMLLYQFYGVSGLAA